MSGALREDWRAVVAVVSGGHFLSHFYFLALPPLFPLLREEFGLSNARLGLLVALVAIGGLLQMPVGSVVDRVGAKWPFVAGVAVTGTGIALVGLGRSYPAMLALAAVAGLGQAPFHPADYALIDAVTDPAIRGRAFSLHTFSGYAGYASAPVVVGTLALVADWRVALFAVGGAGLCYAALSAVVLAPVYGDADEPVDGAPERGADERATERPEEDDVQQTTDDAGMGRSTLAALARPGILAMASFYLLNALASKGLQTFTTVLAADAFGLGKATGNTMLTAFFAVGAVGVLVGGVLADRFAPRRVIAGTLVVGSSILAAAVTEGTALGARWLVVCFGLVGFFATIALPSRDRIVSDLSARGSTGRSFGVVFTGGTVGMLAGPVLLGAVGDATSLAVTFVLVAVVWLAAGAVAFSIGRGWLAEAAIPRPAEGD